MKKLVHRIRASSVLASVIWCMLGAVLLLWANPVSYTHLPEVTEILRVKPVFRPAEQKKNHRRRRDAGDERANAGARGAHLKPVDQNGVDRDVDEVDKQGAVHRDLAVALRAEDRCARVVDRDKGIGGRGEQEVDKGALHHGGFGLPEDEREDVLLEDERCV